MGDEPTSESELSSRSLVVFATCEDEAALAVMEVRATIRLKNKADNRHRPPNRVVGKIAFMFDLLLIGLKNIC